MGKVALTRDDLIEDVRYGRLTPDQAEAEAARLGLPPLATRPGPNSYNPMGETWWTLVMAIAWIAWRSPQQVCEFWNAYRCECWEWRFRERWRIGPEGPVHSGHFLEQRAPATMSLLSLAGRFDEVHQLVPNEWISVPDARAKLWKALSENATQATGIDRRTGERALIADHEWRDLEIFEENERDVLLTRSRQGIPEHGYGDVVVRRQNIMALWPPTRADVFSERLPNLVRPDGAGYMPLYCAAQWIATQGGGFEFSPSDATVWRTAYADLLDRIASEQVAVTGQGEGSRERLGGHLFASCRVDYPFNDASIELILSDELYLCSYPYLDEEHWRGGLDDSLRDRRGTKFSKLMVLKSDVARCWPFASVRPPGSKSEPDRSGAPGRPSSMHLILMEHTARWDRGATEGGIGAEARALRDWFQKEHPTLPLPSTVTVENRIRDEYWKRRKAKPRN